MDTVLKLLLLLISIFIAQFYEVHGMIDSKSEKSNEETCSITLELESIKVADRQHNEKWRRNGYICAPRSCAEATANSRKSGIYSILDDNYGPKAFHVSCDEDLHGGGWTVVWRREDGSVDFNCSWASYQHGFGNLSGEFFIGLNKLHALTNGAHIQELIFVLEDFDNERKYAKYSEFVIGDESEQYAINSLGAYTGDAGDSFTFHASQTFKTSTSADDARKCSTTYHNGWWYSPVQCFKSNLSGKYLGGSHENENFAQGIVWNSFRGFYYSLKFAQMMIRPQRTSD